MNMDLLIQEAGVLKIKGRINGLDVLDIADDSRNVRPGILFAAVRGALEDGHRYIDEAVRKKAAAIVLSDPEYCARIPESIPAVLVKDGKIALCKIADVFFGAPFQHIHGVGVTGTNGKTTVSMLVRDVLMTAGISCGLIGTIGTQMAGPLKPLKNTTPGPVELRRLMREMIDAGCRYVAMEVSSHALDQERVEGMLFRSAIFTNLTQDHLDYHKTMEAYFSAKQKLFFEYMDKDGIAIINRDDPYGARLFESIKTKKLSYGFSEKADVGIGRFRLQREGSSASVKTPEGSLEISTRLVGRHNLYNMMAAIALGVSQRVPLETIKNSIERVTLIPGRLDRIDTVKGFTVFVDYAHTDDALKNVLESLRAIAHNGRIIIVFGCGGDRDKGKRPKMGSVASSLSDVCIITSDNPRSENPEDIIDQIIAGIPSGRYEVEVDRQKAICKALALARPGDIVLIAGKGHETTQIIKDKTYPFDDKLVVKNALVELEKDV